VVAQEGSGFLSGKRQGVRGGNSLGIKAVAGLVRCGREFPQELDQHGRRNERNVVTAMLWASRRPRLSSFSS
jgi:hypothetical protein